MRVPNYLPTVFLQKVLVCSDAMARGLDIENVQVVVNYDSPAYVKVHSAPHYLEASYLERTITTVVGL
jgi:superfamily II DNA/RNA helicase